MHSWHSSLEKIIKSEERFKSINGNMCVVTTDKGEDIKSLKININAVGDASTVSLAP